MFANTPAHEELAIAYDDVVRRTAYPPRYMLVGPGESPHDDVAVVSLHAYRETVRLGLAGLIGRYPTEEELVVNLCPGQAHLFRDSPMYVRGNVRSFRELPTP